MTQGTIYNYVSSKDDILYIWQKNYTLPTRAPKANRIQMQSEFAGID